MLVTKALYLQEKAYKRMSYLIVFLFGYLIGLESVRDFIDYLFGLCFERIKNLFNKKKV